MNRFLRNRRIERRFHGVGEGRFGSPMVFNRRRCQLFQNISRIDSPRGFRQKNRRTKKQTEQPAHESEGKNRMSHQTSGFASSSQRGHLVSRRDGQFIASLIFRMSGMSLDPVPVQLMALSENQHLLPEFLVFHRGFGGRAPTVFRPLFEPSLFKGVGKILAVCGNVHFARLF